MQRGHRAGVLPERRIARCLTRQEGNTRSSGAQLPPLDVQLIEYITTTSSATPAASGAAVRVGKAYQCMHARAGAWHARLPAEDVRGREYVIGTIKASPSSTGSNAGDAGGRDIGRFWGSTAKKAPAHLQDPQRGEHEASGQATGASYDLTVPLARVVAQYKASCRGSSSAIRSARLARRRPARGRFREFYQCDVDSLGSTSPVVEAELCAAMRMR